jgi:hypothetical protein
MHRESASALVGGRCNAPRVRASSQTPLHRPAPVWELPDALFEASQAYCNFVHRGPRSKFPIQADSNFGRE